jgi:uncharacterized protein (DUF924 family)
MPAIDDVLRFWFVDAGPSDWFTKNDAFDQRVRDRLTPALDAADRGELDHWRTTARGCLALCIVMDQAPRNLFRGTADQFKRDAEAKRVATHALNNRFDLDPVFQPVHRMFLYLPFEHSEAIADQELSVSLFRSRVGDDEATVYAERHLEIIQRFGRFPHRNAALGRESTEAEAAFLLEPNSSF